MTVLLSFLDPGSESGLGLDVPRAVLVPVVLFVVFLEVASAIGASSVVGAFNEDVQLDVMPVN